MNSLKNYLNYEFSSGSYVGEDFVSFSTKFRNHIKKTLPEGYTLHSYNRGHYDISGVIKTNTDKFIYFSTSDVRYFKNEWYNNILIRTMAHDKDWRGGQNQYTNLENFSENIKKLY